MCASYCQAFSRRSSPFAPQARILALAGCGIVSPEARVRAKLIGAGIKPHLADCLAPKLVAKLSTEQLEALGQLAKASKGNDDDQGDGHKHRHSLAILEDRLQAVNDPQIVDVVGRAALACTILG
jgi:hypothetical protein